MRRPGPNYRFEDFHAIQSIDDERFLFNWSKTNPLAPLNEVFQPTNEQELRSILLGGYETVRVVGSTLSFEPVHSVHGEAGPAALIDLRSWTGQVAVGDDFVSYKAATTVDQLYADLLEMDRMLPACPGVIGIQTLAGALGTGTHGQGLRQSSLGRCGAFNESDARGRPNPTHRARRSALWSIHALHGMPGDRVGGELPNRAEYRHEVP